MRTAEMDALVQVARRQRPLAFTGAGLSAALGYPLWGRLIARMDERLAGHIAAGRRPMPPKYHARLASIGDELWRADVLRDHLREDDYRAFLAEEFATRPGGPTDAQRALLDLGCRHYLTTNYDRSLAEALERHEGVSGALRVVDWRDDAGLGRFFCALSGGAGDTYLVHVHGRIDEPEGCVLTERDYVARYVRNDETSRKLFAIFLTQPVLFVGFSMTDPELGYLLRGARASVGAVEPRHFAIMPADGTTDEELVRARLTSQFGVWPIFYQATEGHSELAPLLEELAARVHDRPAPVRTSRPLPRYSRPSNSATQVGDEWVPRTVGNVRAASAAGWVAQAPPQPIDPLDPQKGQWGGRVTRDGCRIEGHVSAARQPGLYDVEVVVRAERTDARLGAWVRFHLHPTFGKVTHEMPVRGGVARLRLVAYGAFTVGAESELGTRLELDLAEEPEAPEAFRLA